MARTRLRTAPVPEHNALIASAVRMPPVTRTAVGKTQAWQGKAWEYYDHIGELRFVANWVGNVMNRATLVVAEDIDGVLVVQTTGPAAEAMAAYYGGLQGQQQMLQATGVHLTCAGEMWQAYVKEQWYTLAYNKVSGGGDEIHVDLGDGKRTPIGAKDFVTRVWTPHPVTPLWADSPVRSNLGTLAEIASLNAHVQAQLKSRLAGAGVFFVPSEIQFPTRPNADPAASQADSFMAVLAEAMLTPIAEPDSPSAVVPIVVTAPGEFLGDIKHITFWSELDEKVIEMRDNAVKRLALGLDTPPEVLLGLNDTNHWNAWLVDEAAIKSHLEPRLSVLCHAITEGFLRPSLQGQVPDPTKFYVLADTSDIRLRPNRSKEALELLDRGELSGRAALRETGFKPEDAPTQDERKAWLLKKIGTGSTSPEQTIAALRVLGIDLGPISVPGDQGQITPVLEDRRSLEEHPVREIPSVERSTADHDLPSRAALIAAADVLVYRALERAGNRLCDAKAKANGLGDIPAHRRYLEPHDTRATVLVAGTWDIAPSVLGPLTDRGGEVVAIVDNYVCHLIDNRVPHNRDLLARMLMSAGVLP